MPTQRIFVKPIGGLGNRLKVIDSAVRLAKIQGARVTVIWEINQDLGARFDDLFLPLQDVEVWDVKPGFQWVKGRPFYFPDLQVKGSRALMFNISLAVFGIGDAITYDQFDRLYREHRSAYSPEQHASLNSLFEATKAGLKDLLFSYHQGKSIFMATSWVVASTDDEFMNLLPTQKIKDSIAQLRLPSQYIGMHIRRTDHPWAKEHSTLDLFQKRATDILTNEPNAHLVVVSDDPESAESIKRINPDRVFTYEHSSLDRNETEGIQGALIDLFVLAGAQHIYGSYLSSFSEVASLLGSKPLTYLTTS